VSDKLVVATKKGVFTIERQRGWTLTRGSLLGQNAPVVLPDSRDGSIYAAVALGHFGPKMHRSRDGGATWEELTPPVYPERPPDADDVDPFRGRPIPWSVELIWSLEAGGADQPGRLWCGTIPGGLFRSDDGAATWELVRPLWDRPERRQWFGGGYDFAGIHSICVDPTDSDHVSLGVSCGGVWATFDGGATWESRATGMRAAYMPPEQAYNPNVQDPHRVVQCPAAPSAFWAQHHNGVFRSTDGAASWQEIENVQPSTFGFAIAVHPHDPETAWTVPAIRDEDRRPVDGQLVVSRTRDGGRSWEVFREGLPQEWAYDLTYRHGLDVDESGDRLAFGTTTGSLWVSEDGGCSWQAVSHHLPPISCVRFVK